MTQLALPYRPLAQNCTPKRRTRQQITDEMIKQVMGGHTSFTNIAQNVGVSRRTAYNYWNRWKESEEAQRIDLEWWSLYQKLMNENPEKALECLTRLKYKMIPSNVNVKEEITQNVDVVTYHVTDDERTILNQAARILNQKAKQKRSSSLH